MGSFQAYSGILGSVVGAQLSVSGYKNSGCTTDGLHLKGPAGEIKATQLVENSERM